MKYTPRIVAPLALLLLLTVPGCLDGAGSDADAIDTAGTSDVGADTAVLPAIWQGGYAFDAVVLRYPRSVGVFDPTSAEWIVLVSGGWLE